MRAALARLSDAFHCWIGDHAWYTSRGPHHPSQDDWPDLSLHFLFLRDDCWVFAPPCTHCGAPNPEAHR